MKNFLDLINTFQQRGRIQNLHLKKSVSFLYTNNEEDEKEIRKTIPHYSQNGYYQKDKR
jgi:hypothetical protein